MYGTPGNRASPTWGRIGKKLCSVSANSTKMNAFSAPRRGVCAVRCSDPSRELTTGARRSCAVPEAVHLHWRPPAGGWAGSRRGKRPTPF